VVTLYVIKLTMKQQLEIETGQTSKYDTMELTGTKDDP
jgi:hypothetical protein